MFFLFFFLVLRVTRYACKYAADVYPKTREILLPPPGRLFSESIFLEG